MGNLTADTELDTLGPSAFQLDLSPDWEIWGPNGGYMAAAALEASRRHSQRSRPANITVHFLGVAGFDAPVTLTTETLRASRQATSVAVRMEQHGKPILAAMAWAVDDDLEGLEHQEATAPETPSWRDCPSLDERWAAEGIAGGSPYRFWDNFEQRPPEWVADWANRAPSEPIYRNWMRFNEGGPTTDPWAQAARLLLLVDLGGWPAVNRRHVEHRWMAPTIDVSCEFHLLDTGDEWFLLHGHSPHAGDGLIASHQQIWNDQGRLLASGVSHLLCRRVPGAT